LIESSSAGSLWIGDVRERVLVRGAGVVATGVCSDGYIRTAGAAAAIVSPSQQLLERAVV
jgi:hypothetical protein